MAVSSLVSSPTLNHLRCCAPQLQVPLVAPQPYLSASFARHPYTVAPQHHVPKQSEPNTLSHQGAMSPPLLRRIDVVPKIRNAGSNARALVPCIHVS